MDLPIIEAAETGNDEKKEDQYGDPGSLRGREWHENV
jgi:hypothetical protein